MRQWIKYSCCVILTLGLALSIYFFTRSRSGIYIPDNIQYDALQSDLDANSTITIQIPISVSGSFSGFISADGITCSCTTLAFEKNGKVYKTNECVDLQSSDLAFIRARIKIDPSRMNNTSNISIKTINQEARIYVKTVTLNINYYNQIEVSPFSIEVQDSSQPSSHSLVVRYRTRIGLRPTLSYLVDDGITVSDQSSEQVLHEQINNMHVYSYRLNVGVQQMSIESITTKVCRIIDRENSRYSSIVPIYVKPCRALLLSPTTFPRNSQDFKFILRDSTRSKFRIVSATCSSSEYSLNFKDALSSVHYLSFTNITAPTQSIIPITIGVVYVDEADSANRKTVQFIVNPAMN